jgi:SAM-dependent methyltransferase
MKEDSDQKIARMILEFGSLETKLVLEVGCGDGRITSLLAGKPKQLIAIEPDEEKIREARKKVNGVDFQVGSGEFLEFSDNCFDVIIFTLSLHHQDSKVALSEAGRVLKEDGNILVIEPIGEGEIEQVFALVNDEKEARLEAQKAINESGFIIERSEMFNAKWIFEDKDELCQGLFDHYELPCDDTIVAQICKLLGTRIEFCPITLTDIMIIQSLKLVEC